MENLLELRNKMKKKKPDFLRQDGHCKSKLKKKWRQPKGMHSKMRRKLVGYRKQPSTGFCSPKKVRGLCRDGLKSKLIKTSKDLEGFNPKTDGAIVAKIGQRKRLVIIKKILELKFKILNIKNPQEYLKKIEEKIKKKKEQSVKNKAAKKRAKQEAVKKAEEKKEKEAEENLEEKTKEEKEEKRKVLENKNETY
ncbi:MAG: eL32 family ribosomal protein [Nanoarchaeota archaeon]|nr:eL32 family ribosomal protein [Nanoarchaeota archaeon]